jgi:DNA-binding Lrp family transcriptional regulator
VLKDSRLVTDKAEWVMALTDPASDAGVHEAAIAFTMLRWMDWRDCSDCYPSVRAMADAIGVHPRTLQRWLTKMEARGWIRIALRGRPGGGRTSIYRPTIPLEAPVVVSSEETISHAEAPVVPAAPGGIVTDLRAWSVSPDRPDDIREFRRELAAAWPALVGDEDAENRAEAAYVSSRRVRVW